MKKKNTPVSLCLLVVVVCLPPQIFAFAGSKKTKKKPSKGQKKVSGFGGKGFSGKQSKVIDAKFDYRPDTSETATKLIQFLEAEECEGHALPDDDEDFGVEIGYSTKTGMRGLFAKQDFQAGDFLFAIPFPTTLVVSSDEPSHMTDADRGFLFLENYLSQASEQHMVKWKPYFDSLPSRGTALFDPTPDFFSEEEIESLEFPSVVAAALNKKKQLKVLAEEKGIDFDSVQFATSLTTSRCFSIIKVNRDDGSTSTKSVMMPMMDLVNTSDQPNAELQVIETKLEEESMYALQATRPIPAKKEITISYGSGEMSSIDLLLKYGFVPRTNQWDAAYLQGLIEKQTESDDDASFIRQKQWKTSLEEDEAQLAQLVGNDDDDSSEVQRTIISFRIRMKQATEEALKRLK